MNFMEAVSACFNKYATFSGRALRSEFWYFALFGLLASIIANVLDTALFAAPLGGGWASAIVSLGLLIPNIAVGARRLHDIGKSGWFQLIVLIPLIGAIILIVWFCRRGEDGPNAYGPPQLVARR